MSTQVAPTAPQSNSYFKSVVDYSSSVYATGSSLLEGTCQVVDNLLPTAGNLLVGSTVLKVLTDAPTSYLACASLGVLATQHVAGKVDGEALEKRVIQRIFPGRDFDSYQQSKEELKTVLQEVLQVYEEILGVQFSTIASGLKMARNFALGSIWLVLATDFMNESFGFRAWAMSSGLMGQGPLNTSLFEGVQPFLSKYAKFPNSRIDTRIYNLMVNWRTGLEVVLSDPEVIIQAPLLEEWFFRRFIQDCVLKKGVKTIVTEVAPGKAKYVDSKIYTGIRILITSALFGYVHYGNYYSIRNSHLPDFILKQRLDYQVTSAFISSIFTEGFLYETCGLAASIGSHFTHNLSVTSHNLKLYEWLHTMYMTYGATCLGRLYLGV